MARGLFLGALSAALLLVSAHARALKHQSQNTCQYLPNTYLTTGLYLNRYADVSTADACCQLCQSEFGGCGLFTWCPSDAPEGCFTGGTGGFFETAGACTLYSTASGWTPTVNQQGPQTKWISGVPPNATLPNVPPAKPGVCAPHNNTMLAGTYIQGTTEPTVDACCDRCSNNPDCAAWSYCPAGPGYSCVILSGKQDGQTCNLYSLQPGQKADVVQQGPETTWLSGYRDPEGQYPVPDVTATAPESCEFVENTMLTSKEPWLGGWYDVPDAETCCTRCRNTPTCGVWAYCPLAGGAPCVTSYGQESPASCLLYPASDPSSIYFDQRSNATTWVSGLKFIKEYEIPA